MVDILTCPSQLKMKNKTECFFFMCDWFVKLKHLLFLCTINITLAEFIHIRQIFTIYLYVWYYYTLSYFLYTLVYRCFQLCSTWIKLLTVLLFLKQIFFKKCYPEFFKRFMNNIHAVKRTTTEKEPPSIYWFNVFTK